MDEPFTMYGRELHILFISNDVEVRRGFNINIRANLQSGCVPDSGQRPEEVCLAERDSQKYSNLAYWETTEAFDKPVPFSRYSTDTDLASETVELDCIEKCIETAGCYKVKADATAENNCMLRGNELSPDDGKTFAVNSRTCEEGGPRAWIDGSSETRQYCLICHIEDANSFLDSINSGNMDFLKWSSRNYSTINIVTSSKWRFLIGEDRSPDLTASCIWYIFESISYFRTFLPNNIVDTSVRNEAVDDSAALFQAIALESAEAFVNDLDIGDSGATVNQTDAPEITVEIVKEVATPQDVEFAAAFTAVENVITESITKLRGNLKKLGMIKKRFGWFTDFSDAPCAKYAGEGVGSGVDYVPPIVDSEDPCATIESFYSALLGYYDDFVCMDRAAENPFGERRMQRTSQYLRGSKKHFNRFLNKLSCKQKL